MAALSSERSQPKVLTCYLVEDSALIRENLEATLDEMLAVRVIGYAETEQAAITWMRESAQACDLMIIDIFLRAGSGIGVLQHARQSCPDARLVVLTNFATPEIRKRCAQLGADRVFDKSAELDELLAYCESIAAE